MAASIAVDATGWVPKDVRHICEQGRSDLAEILRDVCGAVALPAGGLTAVVGFIGIASGGPGAERLVAMLGFTHRVLMGTARPDLTQWSSRRVGFWGDAVAGSSARQAALVRNLTAQSARWKGRAQRVRSLGHREVL